MSDPVITPYFRLGFQALFKPSKAKTAPATQEPKYSVTAFFPPTADLGAMKALANAAVAEKWPDAASRPKVLRSPFRKSDEVENWPEAIPTDWIMMTFSAKQDRRPQLVDAQRQDIIDEEDVYKGCWMRAQVRAYAYDNAGNRGVSFGLNMAQKVKEDTPIGATRQKASEVFDAVPTEAATGGDLFS